MGVSKFGFSQDTTNVIMESPVFDTVYLEDPNNPDTFIIKVINITPEPARLIDPVIPTTIDEPVLIYMSEEEIMASPEVEEVVDSVEIIKESVEESEEEILVSPDVEKEVEPVETISKPEEQESGKVIIVSEKVGEEIDSKEKKKYDLFSFFSKKEFESAKFLEMGDGSIILRAVMKDGSVKDTPLTKEEFSSVKNSIEKEDIQKETVEEVAEETTEDKENPKKDKANIVDVVYKIAGVALVIGAIILFPF